MLARLGDPSLYVSAFGLVAAKERERQSDEEALAGGPSLAALTNEVDGLARRLAHLVPAFRYELASVVPRRALLEGKARVLFHSPPLDVIVMTALALVLRATLDPTFSQRLFSHRPGRSSREALTELGGFIREHGRKHPDPRTRGLYVLRRDVKSYGDQIPSDPASQLWIILRRELRANGADLSDEGWGWLVRAIRPEIAPHEGFALDAARGIPTGSPLQPLMGNLYLTEVDKECGSVPGAFYARYGDDIIFAHPDAKVTASIATWIDDCVARLGLTWSADKCNDLYLTAAGRPAALRGYVPATSTKYLGLRVDARGTIGLSAEKATRLLRALSRRLDNTERICGTGNLLSQADAYCAVVNASLDPHHPVADRAAQLLRLVVNDRGQLKDLDYQIALRIAERASGVRGVRAFRALPMRTLRERHGLQSLVVARNRVESGVAL